MKGVLGDDPVKFGLSVLGLGELLDQPRQIRRTSGMAELGHPHLCHQGVALGRVAHRNRGLGQA
jgi:hypothetical protein